MTVLVASRDEVRVGFAALLRANLEGEGKPVQKVYDFYMKNFKASPVMAMTSGGMWPHEFTRRGASIDYRLNCLVFVLRGEAGTDYDEGDADTVLDVCGKGLVDVFAAHQTNQLWKSIRFWQESYILPTRIGAWDYWMETHNMEFKVF